MKYCKNCVMPASKPFIEFDEDGFCNACRTHKTKQVYQRSIDWKQRKKEFEKIVKKIRQKKVPFYNVLVPVSGGKDSIYQIHTALQYQLRVLAVNVDYGIKTEEGIYNLNLIPKMGANLIIVRPEQNYHNKMIKIGFEDFGDPDLMSHALLYSYPLWIAIQFAIPLVLEGENSAFEYGGDEISTQKSQIDREWFYKYVVTGGITTNYMGRRYGIPSTVLKPYDFPDNVLLQRHCTAIFLSHYFRWDSEQHLRIAKEYGFKTLPIPREGTFRNYVGIDEKINRIHQYMKVLKFGYGRATDHACEEIRNGRMTRKEAVALVKKYDGQALSGYYIDDFCKLLNYSRKKFWTVMKSYCNKELCKIHKDGSIEVFSHRQL